MGQSTSSIEAKQLLPIAFTFRFSQVTAVLFNRIVHGAHGRGLKSRKTRVSLLANPNRTAPEANSCQNLALASPIISFCFRLFILSLAEQMLTACCQRRKEVEMNPFLPVGRLPQFNTVFFRLQPLLGQGLIRFTAHHLKARWSTIFESLQITISSI